MTKGPRNHKETWCWSEEVAEVVRERKIKYGKWKKENAKEARKARKECKSFLLVSAYTRVVPNQRPLNGCK